MKSKDAEIVKRLKNELGWFEEFADNDSDWSSVLVRDLLQQILDGKD